MDLEKEDDLSREQMFCHLSRYLALHKKSSRGFGRISEVSGGVLANS